ncbi:unnamed protein product [Ilex paraguariensis]|uniref:Uncharacterized protein n=1 Tax=Ilex paraguariensis TaxID=185542 RepID=A0ABC8TE34_9AQUA
MDHTSTAPTILLADKFGSLILKPECLRSEKKSKKLGRINGKIEEFTLLIKESGINLPSIPPIRLRENEDVTYEAVTTAVRKAVRLNRAIQAKDGHWPAGNAGVHYFTLALVLGVYEWECCNPLPPEFWLFPTFLPYHPVTLSTPPTKSTQAQVANSDEDHSSGEDHCSTNPFKKFSIFCFFFFSFRYLYGFEAFY